MAILSGSIQMWSKSSSDWTSDDDVLLEGQAGFENDTYKIKIGDGSTSWNSLPYVGSAGVTSIDINGVDGIVSTGGPITSSGVISVGVNEDDLSLALDAATDPFVRSSVLGTAATLDTGTSSSDVPTISIGDSRWAPLYNPSFISYSPGSPPSNSTTTPADIDATANITISSTGLYIVQWSGSYTSAATTTGAGFSVSASGGLTSNFVSLIVCCDTATADRSVFSWSKLGIILPSSTSRTATAGGNHFVIALTINVTATGTLVPRFVSEIGGSAITITNMSGYSQKIN